MRVLLVSLLAQSACLFPPDGEELPAATNSPPRIEIDSLSPSPYAPLFMTRDESCAGYRFVFSASDPDGDVMYWRYFLDYTNTIVALESPVSEYEAGQGRQTFVVNPRDTRFTASESDPHTVSLLIADRPFSDEAVQPYGRDIPDPDGLTDYFSWTVEFVPTDEECTVPAVTP